MCNIGIDLAEWYPAPNPRNSTLRLGELRVEASRLDEV